MKNIITTILFTIVSLVLLTPVSAQNQNQAAEAKRLQKENNRKVLATVILLGLKSLSEDKPVAKKTVTKSMAKKQVELEEDDEEEINHAEKCQGVWTWKDRLIIIDKYGNYSEYTENYGSILFVGTYEVSERTLTIFTKNGSIHGSPVLLSFEDNKMYFTFGNKNYNILKFKASVKDFYAQKDKEIANLKANTNRFVAQNQGYVTSGQIKNSVKYGEMRRSYNEELIKAKAEVKWYQSFNNEAVKDDIKRWEEKVYEIEQNIKRLDKNNEN